MELCATVLVKIYDTAGKIPEGAMKSTFLFRGLLLFLLDVHILFWWLKQTKEMVLGFVISCNYSLLKGVGKTPCTPVVSRHSPFIRSPTCFCCSFIGLISCHSEVFSKWLEREQLAAPGWCSGFLLWNFSEGLAGVSHLSLRATVVAQARFMDKGQAGHCQLPSQQNHMGQEVSRQIMTTLSIITSWTGSFKIVVTT